MSQYSIFKEDEKAFHLLHPDGSTFQIAKQAIGPEMVEHIKQTIPLHMSDGGEAPKDPTADLLKNKNQALDDIYNAQSSPVQSFLPKAFDPFAGDVPPTEISELLKHPELNRAQVQPILEKDIEQYKLDRTPEPVATAPQAPNVSTRKEGYPELASLVSDNQKNLGNIPAQTATVAPAKPSPYSMDSLLNADLAATDVIGQAKAKQAEADVRVRDAAAMNEKIAAAKADSDRKAMLSRGEQYETAFRNSQVDPNRVFSNMNTGNKILAGVGLLLGGLGAGASGGPNLALQTIQKTIENDIDAQKTEMFKNKDLLANNRQGLKDLIEFDADQRARRLAAVNNLIERNAAMSGSPIALAQSQIANVAYIKEAQKNAQEFAIKNAFISSPQQAVPGKPSRPGIPVGSPVISILPEEMKKQLARVDDVYMQAKSPDAAKEVDEATTMHAQLKNQIDKIEEFNKSMSNRLASKLPIGDAHGRAKELNRDFLLLKREYAGKLKLSDHSEKILDDIGPEAGPIFTASDEAKSKQFHSRIDNMLEAFRSPRILNYQSPFIPKSTGKPVL